MAGRNLRSRIASAARSLGARAGSIVIVSAVFRPEDEGTHRTAAGLALHVPWEFAPDPHAGLSAAQRALIRPGDRIITVEYVADGRGSRGGL